MINDEYRGSKYLYNKKYIPSRKIIVYNDNDKTVVTMTVGEFDKLKNKRAVEIVNKILLGELDKNYLYLYAYSYKNNETGFCGFIVNKKYPLDMREYNDFIKNIRQKHKHAKFKSIRGDLL